MVVTTDLGDTQSSETTWTFTAVGTCMQSVTVTSFTFGFIDGFSRSCTYSTGPASVTVRYGPEPAVTFAARIRADTLFLDQFAFLRVR